ncbi:NSFL1 cofactor p47-like isoform X1 [Rhodnius prolixus]|uniref:Protein tyrosine phosphatase shp1/cofactor for p97 atpase-mediated vesicle membrane fusion n=3 Tax=Rhodnius TaxID=13248 RepID=A0A4P6DAR8_RHOPR
MSRDQLEEEMIIGFSEITGSPAENSRFFLESANWNLEMALTTFYEGGGFPSVQPEIEPEGDSLVRRNFVQDSNTVSQENEDSNEEPEIRASDDTPTVVSSQTSITIPNINRSSRFATISTVRSNESSSDEEEGQAYYAGGSEHSGQQVVGPWRPPNEIITDLFRSLRDQGGVESISHEPGGPQFFTGQGYRLGRTLDDPNVTNPNGAVAASATPNHREVIVRLWRDGFSVDNGALRSYNDPHEREFLARIRQGHVPAELYPQAESGAVHLSLEDHRHENYVAPATTPTYFTGKGHKLGSAISKVTEEQHDKEVESIHPSVARSVRVDESLPTTTVQIRLPGGDKIQVVLNHDHTVGDLRATIMEQRPDLQLGSFTLMTTFPSRELKDDNVSLKNADVLNSSLLLRH